MSYVLKRKFYKKGYINNITTVGSPTFNGSVVSGFSSTNYIKTIPSQFTSQTASASSWEMVFKVTYKKGSEYQNIWCQSGSYANKLTINASGKVELVLGNSGTSMDIGTIVGTTTLIENTTYWVKAEFTGSAYKLYLSVNGIDFSLEGSFNSTTKINDRGSNAIGVNIADGSNYKQFLGSIDLKDCYIKINGELWWEGINSVDYDEIKTYVIKGLGQTKYYKYFYEDWKQPKLTSNTSYGTITGNSYYSVSGCDRNFWHISDGIIPTTGGGSDNWGTDNTANGWFNWALPEEIIITGIKIYNRFHTTDVDYKLTGARFYTDSSKSTPIGEEFSITTSGGIYELKNIPAGGIKTKNIYFSKTGSTYSGIGELVITAKKLPVLVEGTPDDHSFSIVENRTCVLTINPDNQTSGEKTYYTFTINTIPENAIVTINGKETNSITIAEGSKITWIVSADGYVEKTGVVELYENTVLDIVLVEILKYTFTINPTPSNATVKLNGQVTKSITVYEGTTVNWEVSADGYTTQSGTVTVTSDLIENVSLVKANPLYACYRKYDDVSGSYAYNYAKYPLGSDTTVYVNKSTAANPPMVSTSSELIAYSNLPNDVTYGFILKYTSITEDKAIGELTGVPNSSLTYTRYKDGDLYI